MARKANLNRGLPRFDLWAMPLTAAISTASLTIAIILFLLPPVGLVQFEEQKIDARNVEFEIEDAEMQASYTASILLVANGSFSPSLPVFATDFYLNGSLRELFNNVSITFDGRLTGEDASGAISLRSTFLIGQPTIEFPPFDLFLNQSTNQTTNISFPLIFPTPSFESAGFLLFESTGVKNISAEFGVNIAGRRITGGDVFPLAVIETPEPPVQTITFYGVALAFLTLGLALPSASRNLRELMVKHSLQKALAEGTESWSVALIVVLVVLTVVAVGLVISLPFLSGVSALAVGIALAFVSIFALTLFLVFLSGHGR